MSESKDSLEQLKWIEDTETLTGPPMKFPPVGQNTFKDRLVKKTMENLFVPLGLAATVACLTFGLINMNRGDKSRQQLFMRGRILFQGLTLLAMTAGVVTASIKQKFKSEKPGN